MPSSISFLSNTKIIYGPVSDSQVGEMVKVIDADIVADGLVSEIVNNLVVIIPFGSFQRISRGAKVILTGIQTQVQLNPVLLSNTLDAFGTPVDTSLEYIPDQKIPLSWEGPTWTSVTHRLAPNILENSLHKVDLAKNLESIKILCLSSSSNFDFDTNKDLTQIRIISDNQLKDTFATKTAMILAGYFANMGKFVEVYFDARLCEVENLPSGYALVGGGRVEVFGG